MGEVKRIDEPCCIYRSDIDQYILFGEDVLLFKDSDQAMQFYQDFPMFFTSCNSMIVKAKEHFKDIHLGTIDYDEIADKMEKEKEYQERVFDENKTMKEELKNG